MFVCAFGLIDEPVVVAGLRRLCVEEYDGLAHGAWYGGLGYPRMLPMLENEPTEVDV